MIVTVILNIAILKPAAEESRASRANTCRASGQILRCGSGWRWGAVTWKLVEGPRRARLWQMTGAAQQLSLNQLKHIREMHR
jgi:hypothetical protein